MTDYSKEAAALFARFAERHRLVCSVEPDAPIEVLWEFPAQPGLSYSVTLGLQNGDELNFGVADFWSNFFPFQKSASTFEQALDAWVVGDARIVRVALGGRALQLLDNGRWKTVYRANCLLPVPRNPKRTITNQRFTAALMNGSSPPLFAAPDAKLTSFASCRERLKRGLILMRKSNAPETVFGRQKRTKLPESSLSAFLPKQSPNHSVK